MVKHNYGQLKGCWLLPGGHVDLGENLDAAIEREVMEETGVKATAQGVVAVRSLILPDSSVEVYLVFLMKYVSGQAIANSPDEIDEVGYFTLEEVNNNLDATPLACAIINEVMSNRPRLLPIQNEFRYNAPGYRLYLGSELEGQR